jgi:hypothetical protein
MAVYLTRWFDRWANKQGVDAQSLRAAVREMRAGLYEADLGGRLLKKRIARPGQGKRGGFRTLVATDKESRWIFIYGFAKNERGNLDKDEEQALKKLAGYLLALAPEALERALQAGEVREVSCHAQDKVSHS